MWRIRNNCRLRNESARWPAEMLAEANAGADCVDSPERFDPVLTCDRLIDLLRRPVVRNGGVDHRLHASRPPYLRRRSVFSGIAGRLCRATDECASCGNNKHTTREHGGESALR